MAKNEFINRFVRLDMDKVETAYKKELTIAVYGPTQVGKTTLILSLLGLKKDNHTQLSKWLRGKRKLGVSSTVTVMRYERSQDDYFKITLPHGETITKLSGEQLEAALQQVRSHVETHTTYSVEPVVIEIPSSYFEEREVKMNIVDLPGDESAEEKEVDHVSQCIKHWLPLSEVCLLVDDASQLTAFTQYRIRDIKNWYENLNNFRIIPTRALSLENIRKNINNGKITSAKDLIVDYGKVLNRVLELDIDLTKTIYPLDVGASWEVISKKEPVLYERMKDIMDEILSNLQTDLESLEISELSFNRLTKVYKEALDASKLELQESSYQIEKYKKLIREQNILIDYEENELKKWKNQLLHDQRDIHDFLSQLSALSVDIDSTKITNLVNNYIAYDLNKRKPSVINSGALKLQMSVETDLENKLREIKQEAQNFKIFFDLELPSLKPIPKIDQFIDDDKFWFDWTYEKALNDTRDKAFKWVVRIYNSFNLLLPPIITKVTDQTNHFLNPTKNLILVHQLKIEKLQVQLARYQAIKNDLKLQHHNINEMWKQDSAHAAQLQSYFMKHWLQYKKELEQHFLFGNEEERWFAAQYLQLHLRDGVKIIDSLNDKERERWLQRNYQAKVNTKVHSTS